MSNVISDLIKKTNHVRNHNSKGSFFKAVLSYPLGLFYKREQYLIFGSRLLRADYLDDERRPLVASEELSFKVVTSNQEAEKIEAEGFSFRSQITDHNYNSNRYKWLLDCGLIAFCTFVGKEFAAICWVIPSKKAQKAIKAPPLTVDYANHEVMPRGLWVNPKYRGMELLRYTIRNRDRFLLDKGITATRGTIENDIGKGVVSALGVKNFGYAQWTKVLWFRFWQENIHPQ